MHLCMQTAGLQLGKRYDHHSFMEEVEHKAFLAEQAILAKSFDEKLPSLGIPSDIMLTWDGVSIGESTACKAITTTTGMRTHSFNALEPEPHLKRPSSTPRSPARGWSTSRG